MLAAGFGSVAGTAVAFDEDFADPSDIKSTSYGWARQCHIVDARDASAVHAHKVGVAAAIMFGIP
jgi:hypothetical protein